MILHRIVQSQLVSSTWGIVDTREEYELIEDLVERTKPKQLFPNWHPLIATPFRYDLPIPPLHAARFKPPVHRSNALYGSEFYETSLYEYVYHWLLERVHLMGLSAIPEARTHFTVLYSDSSQLNLLHLPATDLILMRSGEGMYDASHNVIKSNPSIRSLLYPSVRDPQRRTCAVVFDIHCLATRPSSTSELSLSYEERDKSCYTKNLTEQSPHKIKWSEVA